MKKYVVIVAGGTGSRMKTTEPKQFLLLCGKPVLMHTVEAFCKVDTSISIILVVPSNKIEYWNLLCKQYQFQIPHQLVAGGPSRFDSVINGISLITEKSLIAIHDGVRPIVSAELINHIFKTAEEKGNAVPAIIPIDSVRQINNNTNNSIRRTNIRLIQTPQCFKYEILKNAYQTPYRKEFTDDATVVEVLGIKINLVNGSYDNIKITTLSDLKLAEVLLRKL